MFPRFIKMEWSLLVRVCLAAMAMLISVCGGLVWLDLDGVQARHSSVPARLRPHRPLPIRLANFLLGPWGEALIPLDVDNMVAAACADTADTDDDTRIGRSCYFGDAHSSGRVLDLPQARGHGAVEATVVLGKSHPTRDDEDYYYLKGDVRKFRGRFLNGSIASAPSASTSDPVDAVSFFLFPYGKLD